MSCPEFIIVVVAFSKIIIAMGCKAAKRLYSFVLFPKEDIFLAEWKVEMPKAAISIYYIAYIFLKIILLLISSHRRAVFALSAP